MAWYWIVLIVIGYFIIGYFIIGGFFSVIGEKMLADEDYSPEADSIIGAFIICMWPITIPVIVAVYIGAAIASKLLNRKK